MQAHYLLGEVGIRVMPSGNLGADRFPPSPGKTLCSKGALLQSIPSHQSRCYRPSKLPVGLRTRGGEDVRIPKSHPNPGSFPRLAWPASGPDPGPPSDSPPAFRGGNQIVKLGDRPLGLLPPISPGGPPPRTTSH